MSFPNIPDIEPTIVLSREDTVNLLLSSIAMEEHALAQLIEAEKCKVLYVLNECRRRDTLLSDAVTINKSVNETIQNIIKLEMLLQFKLEHVKELVPHKATPTPAASHTPPAPRPSALQLREPAAAAEYSAGRKGRSLKKKIRSTALQSA